MTMVIINELRITPDGKNLIIEASVENLEYYKRVYIDSVVIDTQDTFSANGPSSNPVYTTSFEMTHPNVSTREDCSQIVTGDDCKCGNVYTSQKIGRKNIRLVLKAKDIANKTTLDNDIFFVYIVATGIPEPCTPCGMDNNYVMGIVLNMRPIYNRGMQYVREMAEDCNIPKGFIDFNLRLKALQLALKTGNYVLAIDYWKKLFKQKVSSISRTNKGCGCHGWNY